MNPNLPDWELYPKPRFEYPLKPAKTLVDASKATRAIVRIFFIFSSIANVVIVIDNFGVFWLINEISLVF